MKGKTSMNGKMNGAGRRGALGNYIQQFFSIPAITVLLLAVPVPVTAQDIHTQEASVYQWGSGAVQRLTWAPAEFASGYEVVIEIQDDSGGYIEIKREMREQENFIECSLPVGRYRYQVSVYDLFGRLGAASAWGYFEVINASEPELTRYIYHLTWQEAEFASSYDVVVEKESDLGYTEVIRLWRWRQTFIDSYLLPGRYRFQVTAYNIHDRSSSTSDWVFFDVFEIFDPELRQFRPSRFYLERDDQFILTLKGHNLFDRTEIYLRSRTSGMEIRPRIQKQHDSGERIRLEFDRQELQIGNYDIVVKNPGSFEASLGTLTVGDKPFEFEAELLYAPLIPAITAFPLKDISLRLTLLPFRGRTNYFGLGFDFFPVWFEPATASERFSVYIHSLEFRLYFLWRIWLSGRSTALNFRLGGGSIFSGDFNWGSGGTRTAFTITPASFTGISFQWFFYKSAFIDAGVEYNLLFPAEKDPQSYFRPSLGFGWNF
ncbi:MAG: hypothetical protein LBP76_13905 [Treponema sp.]|jgi:hypothetical protein|nr:hypothetical protein [Treponema sp.]